MPRKYRPKQPTLPDKFEPGALSKLDLRSELGKNLRTRYFAICRDLGGQDRLSYLQQSLIERAIFLEHQLQRMEVELMESQLGEGEQKQTAQVIAKVLGQWIQAINSFSGLCAKLGLGKSNGVTEIKLYGEEETCDDDTDN